MIFGIGTDLVKVARMQDLLDKHQERFALKILSESEFEQFQNNAKPAAFLAKRFAAKEATAKAFGTGFRDGLSLRHISVTNNEQGKPELNYTDKAQALIDQFKIGRSLISISDDGEYAIAYVTLLEG